MGLGFMGLGFRVPIIDPKTCPKLSIIASYRLRLHTWVVPTSGVEGLGVTLWFYGYFAKLGSHFGTPR